MKGFGGCLLIFLGANLLYGIVAFLVEYFGILGGDIQPPPRSKVQVVKREARRVVVPQPQKETAAVPKVVKNKDIKVDTVEVPQTRDKEILMNTPLEEWTEEEKRNNRQLFNEIHSKQLQNSVSELEKVIKNYEVQKVNCTEKIKSLEENISKSEELIKEYKAAAKTGKFPVEVRGALLTKKDLEGEYLIIVKKLKDLKKERVKYKRLLDGISDQLLNCKQKLSDAQKQLADTGFRNEEFKVIQTTDRLNATVERNEKNETAAQFFSDDNKRKFDKEGTKAESIREEKRELLKGLYE